MQIKIANKISKSCYYGSIIHLVTWSHKPYKFLFTSVKIRNFISQMNIVLARSLYIDTLRADSISVNFIEWKFFFR